MTSWKIWACVRLAVTLYATLHACALPAQSRIADCPALKGLRIEPLFVALPTNGARVTSARVRSAGNTTYCEVRGAISPVNPHAAEIRFEINLPSPWNGKAVHFGGAVFDGFLGYSNGRLRPTIALKHVPTPLEQTYVTYGSDSGHHPSHFFLPGIIDVFNATFATNPEQQQNFIKDALKKTHDVAAELMRRYYGHLPSRTFFLGSSSGGHEALEVVQTWPEDYDGVMSGYPAWSGTELALQFIRTSQALYSPGGFLPPSAVRLLAKAVLQSCDKLDGIADGLVSNVAGCQFDPATLLCSMRQQKGCLSEQQLKTVKTFATEQRTVFPLANGVQSMPGYNVLAGAELSPLMLGYLHRAQAHPKLLFNSVTYTIGDRAMLNFVTGDRRVKVLTIDTATGGRYRPELEAVSRSYDASNPDLSRFAAHGGKLVLIHGTADVVIPTESSVMYYKQVRAAMGAEAVDDFMRLYLVPGFGHGTGKFLAGISALNLLDRWNQTGALPEGLYATDTSKQGRGRTRPLCAYPSWPLYSGVGDVGNAASFLCAAPDD